MGGVVAIVGRPNVGKSTFFNRLTGSRKAIVDDKSGVTRDRHYGIGEWQNFEFTLIDTGGYVPHSEDVFEISIKKQVEIAMQEADVLIFMTDVTTEVTDIDSTLARVLRRSEKPVFLVVNKCDNYNMQINASVFYELGFEKIYTVSSLSGSGTGDLLDDVVAKLPQEELLQEEIPRVAIVGKPNVGKSSLCNTLLNQDRNIVTDIAGTTRDTIDTLYNAYGFKFLLTDTAGIRKKSRVDENLEFYSVLRAIRSIESSDVVVILIDAFNGFTAQDLNLFSLAERHGKGIVIGVNKWDAVEKEQDTVKEYTKIIKQKLEPFDDVPILFISALEKIRVHKLLETIQNVLDNKNQKISTSKLNDIMLPIIEKYPPPSKKGKYIKIKYVTQLKSNKTSIAFFCNLPQYVTEAYKRYLENQLRKNFYLTGIPLNIILKKK